jgi:hypothetical protein
MLLGVSTRMPRCLIKSMNANKSEIYQTSDEKRRLWDPLSDIHARDWPSEKLAHSGQINCEAMITTIFSRHIFFVVCEIFIDLTWDWIFLAWDWWSGKWTLGVWLLVCTSTRSCKPTYWTQLVNPTERWLTWQMDPDFMIWYQQSVRKMIMPDM